MRFLFICGSLEPGKDGVGDYVHLLAHSLAEKGHAVYKIALYDPFVTHQKSKDQETTPELRLSAKLRRKEAKQELQNVLDAFAPDWISLQFVPFAFHHKGLPLSLVSFLQSLHCPYTKWHIMFHELWVVPDWRISFRWWILGNLQRLLIWQMIRVLKPAKIHTHAPLYQAYLRGLGCQACILPLFSNIPFVISSEGKRSEAVIRLVVFGSIYSVDHFPALAQEAAALQKEWGKKLALIIIGRSGKSAMNWKKIWQQNGLEFEDLGEQKPEAISAVLQQSHLGISTTPLAIAAKSGATAVMQEHALPILCVAKTWQPKSALPYIQIPGVWAYHPGMLKRLLQEPIPEKPQDFLGRAVLAMEALEQHTILDRIQADASAIAKISTHV